MLKLLLKKQFAELKYSYFRDKKTGQALSKSKFFGKALLLAGLYILFCITFYMLASLLVITFEPINAMWIIFALMALLTIVFGTFVNMFATKALIYDAKDNELLMSLPIQDKDIVLSRLVVTFAQCLIYTSMIWLPTIVCYLVMVEFDVLVLVCGLVVLLVLTALTTVLSCLFGYLIALVSKLFKGKSFLTTFFTIAFIALYYYLYFNAKNYLDYLVLHIGEAEDFFIKNGFAFYSIGKASLGNLLYLAIVVIVGLALSYICYIVIRRNYARLIRMHGSSNAKKFNDKVSKQKSVGKALMGKELKHFLSNSTYTLNAGLGVLLMLVGAVLLVIFKDDVSGFVDIVNQIPIISDMFPIMLISGIACIVSMDCLSTPAVSLEGKTYWIVRTLPVSSYNVLDSKRQLQFKMNVVSALVLILVSTFIMGIGDFKQILMVFTVIVYTSFISFFDLFLGIKGANLKWTSEIVPIKQASNILVAIFGGFIIAATIMAGYYFLYEKISVEIYLCGLIVVFALLTKLIDKWIRTKGVKEFESLG